MREAADKLDRAKRQGRCLSFDESISKAFISPSCKEMIMKR
jgi:hypothetical protein